MSLAVDGRTDHELSVKGLENLEIGDWTYAPPPPDLLAELKKKRKGRLKKTLNKVIAAESVGKLNGIASGVTGSKGGIRPEVGDFENRYCR